MTIYKKYNKVWIENQLQVISKFEEQKCNTIAQKMLTIVTIVFLQAYLISKIGPADSCNSIKAMLRIKCKMMVIFITSADFATKGRIAVVLGFL